MRYAGEIRSCRLRAIPSWQRERERERESRKEGQRRMKEREMEGKRLGSIPGRGVPATSVDRCQGRSISSSYTCLRDYRDGKHDRFGNTNAAAATAVAARNAGEFYLSRAPQESDSNSDSNVSPRWRNSASSRLEMKRSGDPENLVRIRNSRRFIVLPNRKEPFSLPFLPAKCEQNRDRYR